MSYYSAISVILVLCLMFFSSARAATESRSERLNGDAIEKAIGKAGEWKDDVYKISLPRKDLAVSVMGVKINPGLALGSWIAFKGVNHDTVMDGDLVLTEQEVGPVIEKLRKDGVEITALHNHLIGETPRVMFLHVAGKGDAKRLAQHIKDALNLTTTPLGLGSSKGGELAEKMSVSDVGFDMDAIQKELGRHGKLKDGVLQIAIPRTESVKMAGTTLPPTMGMATALNFQDAGLNKVVATGDFVLIKDEVNAVTKALAERGILITALHNHLVHGSPDLYFIHFWANGSADEVAKGLKSALSAMGGH
jgi:Domain of Unknown Function (DUF1259)